LASFSFSYANPAGLPDGYALQYEQSFDSKHAWNDFMMTDLPAWEILRPEGNRLLAITGLSDYEPPHRSPSNISLIKGMTFGSFVLEVDILQSGVKGTPIKEYMTQYSDVANAPGYAHRDHCFFFRFQDPAGYMYIHVAKHADNNAHNVFVVDEADRTPITDFRTIGGEVWKKSVLCAI
tara:strand:+ start:2852 stop:3388 length:537 start_codon:yes stop_codon:yes gene_type:complete